MPETGIIAIEIVEDLCFGTSFSPDLEKRFPEIYAEVKLFLRPILRLKDPDYKRIGLTQLINH